MRLHERAAPGVHPAVGIDELELLLGREGDAGDRRELVEGAGLGALHARTVVAPDVEDERIVGLAHRLDCLDDAADLVVGVLLEAGIDFHLPGVERFLLRRERVPGGEGRVAGRELGVRRYDAQFLLTRERLLAELVPPLVELALVPVGPRLWHMARRVGGASGVVDKERLVGRLGLLVVDPPDRALGEIVGEVVVLALGNADDRVILGQHRVILPCCAAEEAVEVVKP